MAPVPELLPPPLPYEATIEGGVAAINDNSDRRDANRAHKRRQRQRNCESRQKEFDDMLSKIPLDDLLRKLQSVGIDSGIADSGVTAGSNLREVRDLLPLLYTPVPELTGINGHATFDSESSLISECDFWASIPPLCTPDESELNEVIADETLLKKEEVRQLKYKKKLLRKLQDGDITEQEMEEMLVKHGRSSSACNCGHHAIDKDDASGVANGNLMSADRGKRKRCQVENFAMLLSLHDDYLLRQRRESIQHRSRNDTPSFYIKRTLQKIRRVVDFGCGSGNLCLALAAFWPEVEFVFVDKNQTSLELLRNRGRAAGLGNIEVIQCSMDARNLYNLVDGGRAITEDTQDAVIGTFDLGIGLHCCGSFSDAVVELCRYAGASCLLCPCCNGKMSADSLREQTTVDIKKTDADTRNDGKIRHPFYAYPRSEFFRDIFSESEFLDYISRFADDGDNYVAKCLVELDRALWAKTCISGFKHTSVGKLFPETCTPKHHVIWMRQ